MSEENVEATRRSLADFNRRDKATWLLSQDPEVETHPPKEWPENAPIHGAEACWDFYVENTNAFEAGGDFDVVRTHRGRWRQGSCEPAPRNARQVEWRGRRLRLLAGADIPKQEDCAWRLVHDAGRSPESRRALGSGRSPPLPKNESSGIQPVSRACQAPPEEPQTVRARAIEVGSVSVEPPDRFLFLAGDLAPLK